MYWINRLTLTILIALGFVLSVGWSATSHAETTGQGGQIQAGPMPLILALQGSAGKLDRPPVAFDHDRHTKALRVTKTEDCAACHVLKDTYSRLTNPDVKVFTFPKTAFDRTDKTSTMYAYHEGCVSCHRNMAREGKKTGPDIGLCGKCHEKNPQTRAVKWAWTPLFTYVSHAKHVQAAQKWEPSDQVNVAANVTLTGEASGKKCETCHHTVDATGKKLVYAKDSENSCRACHKSTDGKTSRSMKHVAHAACIGCHMKLSEKVTKEAAGRGKTELTAEDKKKFGPVECAGCHGEHKELTPDERAKVPRLVRGQKDVMDLALTYTPEVSASRAGTAIAAGSSGVRMKVVPFNHKAHEPRGQFCNSCHHYSLEKCGNCHTPTGTGNKGGNVSYEQAFHRSRAKQSCVGCHDIAKQDKQCAGCHQWQQSDTPPKSSCPICHAGPSGGKATDVPPMPLFTDKEKVPEKLLIKGLEKQFQPAELPHMKIVNKMVGISNSSSLARQFHATKDMALCSGCHHRSDLQQSAVQAPKCSSCHGRSFDANALGRPGILAAYHRQCMGCHQAMHQKPAALECVKCHPAKPGAQTAGLIPPVSDDQEQKAIEP